MYYFCKKTAAPRQKDFSAMYTIFRESMINWESPNIKDAHA